MVLKHRPPFFVAALCAVLTCAAQAQPVLRAPQPDEPLETRWKWALQEAGDNCPRGCWIGYGIRQLMERDSYIGSWRSDQDNRPSLQSLLYGREVEPRPDDNRNAARRALNHLDRQPRQKVMKEIALLFRLDSGGKDLHEITLSNISMAVDLENLPLLWLGTADHTESIAFLDRQYKQAKGISLKEELVSAVGLHRGEKLAAAFLTEVLNSRADGDLREKAVFWLAEQDQSGVLPLLERTARNDADAGVREQAVFGISRIDSEAATERLIDMARHLDNPNTREKAIFWLGQKASQKAAENLEDIAVNDPNVEIQKKAVFAISQLPGDQAVPRLISIARTHKSAPVRNDAIFWLGQTGDERAVDALVEIVRGQ